MQVLSILFAAALILQPPAQSPPLAQDGVIQEGALMKISEHVYMIPDGNVRAVPNVGIVLGDRAALVIDSGLGTGNGQTILRELRTITQNTELYLVATHFHAEHALGESGFPATARVVRARAQQRDMDEFGIQPNFAAFSPTMAELMKDAQYRRADELFDNERVLDLGGVRVRLFWFGGTHTNGDTMAFVEDDRVLFAGDVVMNRRFLAFRSDISSVRAWLGSLDKLEPLRPDQIVPSHGAMGDASLIETNRTFLRDLEARVAELKRAGRTLEETEQQMTNELSSKYPDWTGNPAGAVRSAYNEAE